LCRSSADGAAHILQLLQHAAAGNAFGQPEIDQQPCEPDCLLQGVAVGKFARGQLAQQAARHDDAALFGRVGGGFEFANGDV